jgi:transcriptional regulator with XRE-family HTH domain
MRIRKGEYAVLARVLRNVRSDSGLTQVEVAEKIGVAQSFVSKYESGERRLDFLELREVAIALNVSPTALIAQVESALSGAK